MASERGSLMGIGNLQRNHDEEILIKYLPLVKRIAGSLTVGKPPTVEYDDLVSYGILGLLDAINKFDPTREIKFETYATYRIRGSILDELRKINWVPRSETAKLSAVDKARRSLEAKLQREPTQRELAQYLGVTVEELNYLDAIINYTSMISLESLCFSPDEGERRLIQMVPDEKSPNPETLVEEKEKREFLIKALDALPEKDRIVLNLYYKENLTLKEIGKVLGISESRVCQLHSRAIIRLRTYLQELR